MALTAPANLFRDAVPQSSRQLLVWDRATLLVAPRLGGGTEADAEVHRSQSSRGLATAGSKQLHERDLRQQL